MPFSIYLRLVVLTAGTLLPFFWTGVILGHRRQRNFERIFFFFFLALVFLFWASLLVLNAQLYYAGVPLPLTVFCWTVLCVGLWFLPSLLVHLHAEYAQIREQLSPGKPKRRWLLGAYVPSVVLLPWLYGALRYPTETDFILPSNRLGWLFQAWLITALLIGAGWQWRFAKGAPDKDQARFHNALRYVLAGMAVWLLAIHLVVQHWGARVEERAAGYIAPATRLAVDHGLAAHAASLRWAQRTIAAISAAPTPTRGQPRSGPGR